MDKVGQGNAHWELFKYRFLRVLLHGLVVPCTGKALGAEGEAARRFIQWSQCQGSQYEPTAGPGWAHQGPQQHLWDKRFKKGENCNC